MWEFYLSQSLDRIKLDVILNIGGDYMTGVGGFK